MLILFWFACTTTCEQVCDKLSTCSDIDQGIGNSIDCQSACLAQQEAATNDDREESFSDLKNCLSSSTCSDIEEGICYDEELYSW